MSTPDPAVRHELFSTHAHYKLTSHNPHETHDGVSFLPDSLVVETFVTGPRQVTLTGPRTGQETGIVTIQWVDDVRIASSRGIQPLAMAPDWVRRIADEAVAEGRLCSAIAQESGLPCGHDNFQEAVTGYGSTAWYCLSCVHECTSPIGHDGAHRCPCGAEWDLDQAEQDLRTHETRMAKWRLDHLTHQITSNTIPDRPAAT